jgi:hypothetical protein
LFELGVIQSGFWHQFALTAHSPIGINPEAFGIQPEIKNISFANNDIAFKDKTGLDHSKFSFGLKKSLFNYMHGICFEYPLQDWFEFKIPKTSVPKNLIVNYLEEPSEFLAKPNAKIVWLGSAPLVYEKNAKKVELVFHTKTSSFEIDLSKTNGKWLLSQLPLLSTDNEKQQTLQNLKEDYEKEQANFELFWYSKPMQVLKENGLLAL